jgi:23S rRNA (uridine2552-2'-O)-methyltransferase
MARKRRKRNPYRGADHVTRAARAAGYAARSVFKLEEIDRRVRLLRQGQRVLDLGAAPGSWAAYAAERVGPGGRVVAIDRAPLRQPLPPHAIVVEGDAFDEGLLAEGGAIAAHRPYQVVLSDMAPSTTGHRTTDQLRSMELFSRAVAIASQVLAPGGSFVGKLFMSGTFDEARALLRERFETVRIIRPRAVRDVSYEVFLVGLGAR